MSEEVATQVVAQAAPVDDNFVPEVSIPVEDVKLLRIVLDRMARGTSASAGERDSQAAPAIKIADTALRKMDLRFEHGLFIPKGHYLDKMSGEIIPVGFKWNSQARCIVPEFTPMVAKQAPSPRER